MKQRREKTLLKNSMTKDADKKLFLKLTNKVELKSLGKSFSSKLKKY